MCITAEKKMELILVEESKYVALQARCNDLVAANANLAQASIDLLIELNECRQRCSVLEEQNKSLQKLIKNYKLKLNSVYSWIQSMYRKCGHVAKFLRQKCR